MIFCSMPKMSFLSLHLYQAYSNSGVHLYHSAFIEMATRKRRCKLEEWHCMDSAFKKIHWILDGCFPSVDAALYESFTRHAR